MKNHGIQFFNFINSFNTIEWYIHITTTQCIILYIVWYSQIQWSYYVIAELLDGDDTEPGPETTNWKGRSNTLYVTDII